MDNFVFDIFCIGSRYRKYFSGRWIGYYGNMILIPHTSKGWEYDANTKGLMKES
jgi:hypothetical protein